VAGDQGLKVEMGGSLNPTGGRRIFLKRDRTKGGFEYLKYLFLPSKARRNGPSLLSWRRGISQSLNHWAGWRKLGWGWLRRAITFRKPGERASQPSTRRNSFVTRRSSHNWRGTQRRSMMGVCTIGTFMPGTFSGRMAPWLLRTCTVRAFLGPSL